jgi:hypothetical protein
MKMNDLVEIWCSVGSEPRFRDSIERKFWGDVFSAASGLPKDPYVRKDPKLVADEALVHMRIRQGTIEQVGRYEESFQPVGYKVCAVCEGREKHVQDCPNHELRLPIGFDLKVIPRKDPGGEDVV